MYRYIVVGGNKSGASYTGLSVIGRCNSLVEAEQVVNEKYNECGGLLIVIDTKTGEQVATL